MPLSVCGRAAGLPRPKTQTLPWPRCGISPGVGFGRQGVDLQEKQMPATKTPHDKKISWNQKGPGGHMFGGVSTLGEYFVSKDRRMLDRASRLLAVGRSPGRGRGRRQDRGSGGRPVLVDDQSQQGAARHRHRCRGLLALPTPVVRRAARLLNCQVRCFVPRYVARLSRVATKVAGTAERT